MNSVTKKKKHYKRATIEIFLKAEDVLTASPNTDDPFLDDGYNDLI